MNPQPKVNGQAANTLRGSTTRLSATRQRARRGGVVTVYFALIAVTLLGVCALVVDEGYWFYRKAEMQKAADAAAMAGASALITGDEDTAAGRSQLATYRIAKANGFDNVNPRFTVSWMNDANNKKLVVSITSPEPKFFGQIYGAGKINIAAAATAIYDRPSQLLVPITGANYGVNTGPINLGIYGPEQITNRGDLYGVRYTTNSQNQIVPNPKYRPEGYSFAVNIPSDFGNTAKLQIYDADSYDSGADATAADKVWDEGNKDRYIIGSNGQPVKSGRNAETITRYSLYSDGGTPYDISDDSFINSTDIGARSDYDKQWKEFFNWNPQNYRMGKDNKNVNFRVSAQTISGCNENGFNMRIVNANDTDQTFINGGNGTDISAIGDIPVNFGKNGTGTVALGYVPKGAKEVRVDHFDSDVGVTAGARINYSYENGGARSQTYYGNPLLGSASDNVNERDVIKLSSSYQGGKWQAIYNAGASDNTTWSLTYDGPPTGKPGYIRLVN